MNNQELVRAVRKLFARHVMSDQLTDAEILDALLGSSLEASLAAAVGAGHAVYEPALALNGDALTRSIMAKLGIDE